MEICREPVTEFLYCSNRPSTLLPWGAAVHRSRRVEERRRLRRDPPEGRGSGGRTGTGGIASVLGWMCLLPRGPSTLCYTTVLWQGHLKARHGNEVGLMAING